jgi:hypothetical protein
VAVAYSSYPVLGDPTFSYCYRAELIAGGDLAGVFLMWHPPGYPLLLAVVAKFGISPYLAGAIVNLAAFVFLVAVVDRLVAARTWHPVTRLTAAAFLAFQETLFANGSVPVTEPVYLLLLYFGVWLLSRPAPGRSRCALAGLLFGLAVTLRYEGLVAAVGVTSALAGAWAWTRKRPDGTPWYAAPAFVVGVAVGCGWLLANVTYVRVCVESQHTAYTIPPASGVRDTAARAVKCGYHAVTSWLPQVMLLPFWVVAGAGLAARPRTRQCEMADALMVCLVILCIPACSWTVMHKRIGSFLLPAAAVWFAVGVEAFAARFRPESSRAAFIAVAIAVGALLLQAGRVLAPTERAADGPASISVPAAKLLAGHAGRTDPVWAFGSEPEIYALGRARVVYRFFDRGADEALVRATAGHPDRFVAALRDREVRFLTFALSSGTPSETAEPQRYFAADANPRRDDLAALVDRAGDFGLRLIGSQENNSGTRRVYVFAIGQQPTR